MQSSGREMEKIMRKSWPGPAHGGFVAGCSVTIYKILLWRMSSSPFASEIKKAKVLEARLESSIQRYSALAQKINADLLCDEENPLIESNDEKVTTQIVINYVLDMLYCQFLTSNYYILLGIVWRYRKRFE